MSLADSPGIIHNTTKKLANLNIDIKELSSNIITAPMSGTPMFKLNIVADIPENINIDIVKNNLQFLEIIHGAEVNVKSID